MSNLRGMAPFIMAKLRYVAVACGYAIYAAAAMTRATPADTLNVVHWTCSGLMLPDYRAKAKDAGTGEAVTYLYVGYKHHHARSAIAGEKYFRSDYGADALFNAPLDGKHGWYDSGIRLGPLNENNGFVQIEISRWERFDYEGHIAIAWALPHSNSVEYRDLRLMTAGGTPHRLGIYVRDGFVYLLVDQHEICSTQASHFVSAAEPKYFQVRTETNVVGSNGNASAYDLRVKRDVDSSPRPYQSDCILHRYGIFWRDAGRGRYTASGAFDPAKATFFTGKNPTKPCRTQNRTQ